MDLFIRKHKIPRILFIALLIMMSHSLEAQFTTETLVKDFSWRNIGPPNMSGRISDIEALDADFSHVLVATASGGVYKSTNAGITWQAIFDNYGSASIGDIAICQQEPDIIWVGTGEANTRNSIAWGDGIYKSEDGGVTFENMGLEDTGHIKRVSIHPEKKNTVYVAAQGHLWGYSGDRGLFKTDNGGKSWKKLMNGLPDDGKTGCTDIRIDPEDPDILYAAFWERLRTPYRFDSGGPNGGLFKSEDGGKSWEKLTNGLPEGDTGKILLDIYKNDSDIIMAMVEHGYQPERDDPDYDNLKKLGSGIYRSENGGKSWKLVNRYNNRPFYYSHIRINPVDDQIVYILTGSFYISYDGGKTLESQNTNHHGDYHAHWADPMNKDRYYIGSDGGAALTHDHGENYLFYHNIVAAQYYAIGVDMRNPYWIFGGLQDNGTWGGPSRTRDPNGILKDHWIKIGGGDGFHAQVDPTDWRTVYYESQGGSFSRKDILTGQNRSIKPRKNNIINYDDYITPEIEEDMIRQDYRDAFRFNWSSPIVVSNHNPQTIYFAANYMFRSVDKGDSWMIISPDLTTNDPVKTNRKSGGMTDDITGAETHCTIITISESSMDPKVIWAGTDDGNVQVTQDGGLNWTNVRPFLREIPEEMWVSRVEGSHFEKGTAYVTFEGHRSDNFSTWVFKTEDFGRKWTNITSNLPDGHPLYVVKQDKYNPDLLFAGSEFACFITLDEGKSWAKFMNEMPTVAFHDLVIHPRDGDLIAATHGRGIWIADNISPLRQLTAEVREKEAHLFEPRDAIRWQMIQKSDPRMGHLLFSGINPANSAGISYFLKNNAETDVKLEITDITSENTFSTLLDQNAGFHKYEWNLSFSPTERQRNAFIVQMNTMFDNTKEEVESRGERRQIDELKRRLENARSDDDRIAVMEEFVENFEEYMPGRRFFRGLQGPAAPAGEYLVRLTVNGETMITTLTLSNDPILSK
ncbi:WD40/YVTN/BNR-like repeat-containing protein [candidate division KSB1 bacterium]